MLLAGFDGTISDCFTARLRSYSQCKHNAEPHDSASDLHLGYAKVVMADTIGNGSWKTRTPSLNKTLSKEEVICADSVEPPL